MSKAPPFVSAILLSYNCADQILAALQSILDQKCEPMEVIVSDDASQDATFTILQREVAAYQGPHLVRLRRRETNSGSKQVHLKDIFPLASGQLLIFFDGDDIAEPNRVRRIVAAFRANPRVSAVYSDYVYMDPDGRSGQRAGVPHQPPGADARHWFAKVDAYAAGSTLAIRRDVAETFDPLDPAINEDVVLPFRASLIGDVHYIDEALVRYRRWEGNFTRDPERFRSIENLRSWLLRGIEEARRRMEIRLADLDKPEELGLLQAKDLDALRATVAGSMAEATACLASPSLVARLRRLVSPESQYRRQPPHWQPCSKRHWHRRDPPPIAYDNLVFGPHLIFHHWCPGHPRPPLCVGETD